MLKQPPSSRTADPGQDPGYRQRWAAYWQQSNNPDRPNRFWTASLLIPYSYTDTGARAIPVGTEFWLSPYIWVESNDPLGNPVAGQPNFVHCSIWNYGMAEAAWVYVDFYWADPSLGLGPGDMNPIGHERVIVHRGEIKEVTCRAPWIPVMRNEGHECLMVNCHSHVLAPIHYPFQPVLDPQVGQHNMHVVEAAAGETMSFSLNLNNPFGRPIETAVALSSSRFPLPHRVSRRALLERLSHDVERIAPERTGFRVSSRLGPGSVPQRAAKGGYRLPAEPLPVVEGQSAGGPHQAERQILHEVGMAPLERRRMEISLEIPPDRKHGEVTVFHFEQLVREITIGGYCMAVIQRVTASPNR